MPSGFVEKTTAQVLLPRPFDQAFTYQFESPPPLGAWVEVPFGSSALIGVVWDKRGKEGLDLARLRSVLGVLEIPPMAAAQRTLIARLAAETMMTLGAALRLAMPPRLALFPKATETRLFRVQAPGDLRLSDRQQTVLDSMGAKEWERSELIRATQASSAILTALIKKGVVLKERVIPEVRAPLYRDAPTSLNSEQTDAANTIAAALDTREAGRFLLDGVTGSGKTHVYFASIARALALGRQVLWLVPEIALTDQLRERFVIHFGAEPLVWHSEAGTGAKARAWRIAAAGRPCVILGARSALHVNFTNLGLVIVDEEHEQALKQTDMGAYHGRDMAEHRAHLSQAVVVLGSATPSLETEHRARTGHLHRLTLRQRHKLAPPPRIVVVDLRRSPPKRGRWLAPALITQVQDTLNRGQQAMLFLNRRGYAPLSLCANCGRRVECHQCSAWLVEHRFLGTLQCHLCGTPAPKPTVCPACDALDSLVPCGPGIERLMEEAVKTFSDARIGVFSSDTLRTPAETRAAFAAVADGSFNLLIGTQVLAKGLDFPELTLVGVVDADLGLCNEDLRAGERTFQLLHQVTGRVGRGQVPGRALIQTRTPDSDLMQALIAHDRAGFYTMELQRRQAFSMPPFARLATLMVADENPERLQGVVHDLHKIAPHAEGVDLWGPTPARLPLVRGWHRQRFVVRVPKGKRPQSFITAWLKDFKFPSKTRVSIDIDPLSFT